MINYHCNEYHNIDPKLFESNCLFISFAFHLSKFSSRIYIQSNLTKKFKQLICFLIKFILILFNSKNLI